ncbi:glycosyltransferase [Flavobacterium sp. ACN6]|uniref:glycosyltransferase n=1 Tax=Flavobacterium sp. ACN6 TaxID=1920426 RepID=UPI000BB3D9E1|nr:glycosyltransferase [Flavobacterium sp. ACN6]PBJ13868.1 Glycosyl transferase family 2 [Flavobacterium sp. ACN6]
MDKMLDNFIAIIVIYNKELYRSETLKSLGEDLEILGLELDLFIYDNSANKQEDFKMKGFNIVNHFWNGENIGVSGAYNEGVKFANIHNKEWALLLDQDTLFENGAIFEYLKNINLCKDVNLFTPIIKIEDGTIFSPFKKVFKRGVVLKKVSPVRYSLKNFSPVNSGILVRISSFLEAGGYNKNVKLDFSDIEFIRKFAKYNKEFKVVDTSCIQDFSNSETDANKLNVRFDYFCDGIKNCERNNLYEHLQFFIIVFLRMGILIARTRKIIFIKTFYNSYLK